MLRAQIDSIMGGGGGLLTAGTELVPYRGEDVPVGLASKAYAPRLGKEAPSTPAQRKLMSREFSVVQGGKGTTMFDAVTSDLPDT